MEMWKNCILADLGEVVGGATPSTKVKENYDGGTIPWITPKDLAGFQGRFISRGERNITEQGLRSCSTQIMPKDTVLFSSRAPIGYVAIAKTELCTNQGFKSIVPNANTDPLFLYYLLVYNKDRIENMGVGTTFKEVSATTMRGIPVRVPTSVSHQKHIANTLSMLDERIECNLAINKNLEEQARAIFDAWFISFDVFNGNIPKSWKTLKLSDVAKLSAGGDKPVNVSVNKSEQCPYPIYSNGTSLDGLYGYTEKPLINEESVTVSARGTIGFVCLRHIPYVPIVRLITVIPKKECISAKYLYFWLKNLSISGTGTTQQQLTVPFFKNTEILVPPIEIITDFTDTVSPLFSIIYHNENEVERLTAIRDALLPRLMSGELDVSNIAL